MEALRLYVALVPTPAEHRALLFVAALAALGFGVRGFRAVAATDPPASNRESLSRQIAAVDSVIAEGGRKRAEPSPKRSLSKNDALAAASIDMDRAMESELDRLPGIGPALAARIVADRTARGPFGSIDGLKRVKGIGPALAGRVQPYVTFSLPPRPTDTEISAPGGTRRP